MNKTSIFKSLATALALLVAMLVALFIRISAPFATVFSGQWVKLTGIDAYYYMRLVDNLQANFPRLIGFDPYLLFPTGDFVNRVPNFFVYLLTVPVKLLGGANPSTNGIESIAVYVPAVLGALTIIPVYFLAKSLANRWAGIIAAFITAILPGEFLLRSLLGYTDHHVAEVLFSVCFVLFFVLALKHGRAFTYESIMKGGFPAANRQLPYAILAGISMGLYTITWQGAPLMVLIVFAFFVVQFVSDHLRGFPTDYLSKTAIVTFLITLLIVLPVWRDKLTLLALASVMLIPIVLNVFSAIMAARQLRRIYYLYLVIAVLAGTALFGYLAFRQLFYTILLYAADIFSWRTTQAVVGEMKPLFFQGPPFSLDAAWNEWGLVLYTGLAGLVLLAYRCVRKGYPEYIFVAVWSSVLMLATFGQIRFSYYFAVCLAILTAFAAGHIMSVFQAGKAPAIQEKSGKKAKRAAAASRAGFRRGVIATVLVLVAAVVVVVPEIPMSLGQAKDTSHAPSDAWMNALQWMKDNTPEPLGSAASYYAYYTTPEPGQPYPYPAEAYGVAVWGDYGYWVTQIGHRIPVSNPTAAGAKGEVQYFSAQDDAAASKIMQSWGAKYVITDNRLASPNDKFYVLADLNNKAESDYYELCWEQQGNKYVPKLVFYPDFYTSMIVRLEDFDGLAYTPQATSVMSYQDRELPGGQTFTQILSVKNFKNYSDAQSFVASQQQGLYKIIGTDPLVSPVPLEQLKDYKLVYGSAQKASSGSPNPVPAVKIFEYNAAGFQATAR